MSEEIWDQFRGSDGFVKFESHGDKVVGTVVAIRVKDWPAQGNQPAKQAPELLLEQEDGTTVSLTANQVMLQRKLAEVRPKVGDKIAVVYTGDSAQSQPGRSPAKLFDVQVKASAGDGEPAAAGAAASSGVSAIDLLG